MPRNTLRFFRATLAEAAIRHLRGESVPREISPPVEIVDRANYAAWDLPFEARALPVWDAVPGKT